MMSNLRATERWYGRGEDPRDVVDSAPSQVSYDGYFSYLPPPPTLSTYDIPPVPTLVPVPERELVPPYGPEDMVIPGVQHADGTFEPHQLFARRTPVSEPPAPDDGPKDEQDDESTPHVVELAVPVCCEACEERVTNYLEQFEGVDAVECDVQTQTVKVVGQIAPADALQHCKQCFRKSTLV